MRLFMLNVHDRDILRSLAEEIAGAAALPVQKENLENWRKLNSLQKVRPLLWINEICYDEISSCPLLQNQCCDQTARQIEVMLRRILFQFKLLPGDMIVEPFFYAPLMMKPFDFGVPIEEDVIRQNGDVNSHHYKTLFKTMEDAMKIVPPVLEILPETQQIAETADDVFGDILPVKNMGVPTWWFSPWDYLSMRWDTGELLMALVLEPELVKTLVRRFLDASVSLYRQFEEKNLLTVHHGNYRVGSGGMGCAPDLEVENRPVKPSDQWGCAVAQIFGSVSPEMHEELSLVFDREWLKQFKYAYYGCCEALHNKIGILRSISNLRKISASPWCDLDKLVDAAGKDFVVSMKPNPAVLAEDVFNLEKAEKELRARLDPLRGVNVEVILKDISTLRGDWQRLSQWAEMALRVCREYEN